MYFNILIHYRSVPKMEQTFSVGIPKVVNLNDSESNRWLLLDLLYCFMKVKVIFRHHTTYTS